MRALVLGLLALLALPATSSANEVRTMTLPNGSEVRYVLVLPDGYDPAQKYEALLAFPGGNQSIERTVVTVERFWEPEAVKRGVIVVAPSAPTGRPFYMGEGSVNLIPDIVAFMRATYAVKDGPIHLGGHSNGGITAFRAAIRWPEMFQTLTVIAGTPAEPPDTENLDRLKGLKISLFVGSGDFDWREPVMFLHRVLKEIGVPATLNVVARSGHQLEALSFDRSGPLFDTVVPAAKAEGP